MNLFPKNKVTPRTDAELVRAARQGDVDSFGELYCRHYVAVVGMAYCIVGDRHLAEDAGQEAFAAAGRDLARLRDENRFVPWIGVIVRRVAGRMARSHRERGVLEDVVAPMRADSQSAQVEALRQAVLQLPASTREVVVLHYFSGLSHKEVAEILGISTEAVHGRLVRARRSLADRLNLLGMGVSQS